jgi:hypothetical protein
MFLSILSGDNTTVAKPFLRRARHLAFGLDGLPYTPSGSISVTNGAITINGQNLLITSGTGSGGRRCCLRSAKW